jgi:hypothetical protein
MFVSGNCINCPACYGSLWMQQSTCQSSTSMIEDPDSDVFFKYAATVVCAD